MKSKTPSPSFAHANLDDVLGGPLTLALSAPSQTIHAAAVQFWESAMDAPHLSARMKELVLLALHACSSAVNDEAIRRHVRRAITAGASETDVLDVLLSIVGQANHALYFALPILVSELGVADVETSNAPELREDIAAIKEEFVRTRGFWNKDRDLLARFMPDYFTSLSALSMAPWKDGSLSACERELVYIAIDASVTHMFEAGLRLHIRNALNAGATQADILEVLHLVSLVGLEGYVIGASTLMRDLPDSD